MMTPNKVQAVLRRTEELISLLDDYVREMFPNTRRGDVRIQNGMIEERVNTSCHCHPEYDWVDRSTVDAFYEWLDKRNSV